MALNRFLTTSVVNPKKNICILKSFDANLPDIMVTETKMVIGRSTDTGIKDIECSKEQLVVKADLENNILLLKACGPNPSALNGFKLRPGVGYEACENDIIDLLHGRLQYQVIFNTSKPQKRKILEDNPPKLVKTAPFVVLGDWDSVDGDKLIIFTHKDVKATSKIAAFDLDGTLITTMSGNVFPKSISDWKILYPGIPQKLKSLVNDGYKLVIFTNQAGISKGKLRLTDFNGKITAILNKFGVPMQVFIATDNGTYRKPMIGMWNYLKKYKNDGIEIKINESFYVGDAAGRPAQIESIKRKKDHSSVDRLMAINIGIKFYTPEEYFHGEKPIKWSQPLFHPSELISQNLYEPRSTKVPSNNKEIIVLVGLPGSGKSFYAHNYLENIGYTIVNRDKIETNQNCEKACKKALNLGKSVVIDNTNIDIISRKRYIDIAKQLSVSIRCFVMNTKLEQIKHNILFREITDKGHSKINPMILNSMKKRYVMPTEAEGFVEIARVNCVPKFNNIEEENLYKMYLTEK